MRVYVLALALLCVMLPLSLAATPTPEEIGMCGNEGDFKNKCWKICKKGVKGGLSQLLSSDAICEAYNKGGKTSFCTNDSECKYLKGLDFPNVKSCAKPCPWAPGK